jgi:RNA polymerase-interacting CarD/CdnL/TRCF family regulator
MTDLDDLESRIAENEKHGLYTSPAVKELISELRELRSMRRADNEDIARAYDFARDKGQALERAAVVAWLRKHANDTMTHPQTDRLAYARAYSALHTASDSIERGEHRRKEAQ